MPQPISGICQQSIADAGFRDCCSGRAIVKDQSLLIGSERYVYGDRDSPKRLDSNEGSDEFRRIVEQNRHPLANLKIEGVKNLGGANCSCPQLAISNFAVIINYG